MNAEEQKNWTAYCQQQLLGNRLPGYFVAIKDLRKQKGITKVQQYLLDELEDYGKSLQAKLT